MKKGCASFPEPSQSLGGSKNRNICIFRLCQSCIYLYEDHDQILLFANTNSTQESS